MKNTGKGRYMVDLLFMGEGGTPAFLLSLKMKFGGNMMCKKFFSSTIDVADSLLFCPSNFRMDICYVYTSKKSGDTLSY